MTKKLFQMIIEDRNEDDSDAFLLKFDNINELVNKVQMYNFISNDTAINEACRCGDDTALFRMILSRLEDDGYIASVSVYNKKKGFYHCVGTADSRDEDSLSYMRWEDIERQMANLNK